MEHLNGVVKPSIEVMGGNKSGKAIVRAGKCMGKFIKVLSLFDKQADMQQWSGDHSEQSYTEDLHQLIEQLLVSNTLDSS